MKRLLIHIIKLHTDIEDLLHNETTQITETSS